MPGIVCPMSETSLALEYAVPADRQAARDHAVLTVAAVGAIILAAYLCFGLAWSAYYYATQPGGFGAPDWSLAIHFIELAGGPMLMACALLALTAARRPGGDQRAAVACAVTAVFLIGLKLIRLCIDGASASFAGAPATLLLYASRELATAAGYLCLFLPILLIRAPNAAVWRSRALAVAAGAILLAGLAGIPVLARKATDKQRVGGGTFAEGMHAALRDPMPIVGLWPAAGLAAAVLLLVAIGRPRVALIGFGLALAVTYQGMIAWNGFSIYTGVTGVMWDRAFQIHAVLLFVREVIPTLLPAALIAWALWRDSTHFLPEPMLVLPA